MSPRFSFDVHLGTAGQVASALDPRFNLLTLRVKFHIFPIFKLHKDLMGGIKRDEHKNILVNRYFFLM